MERENTLHEIQLTEKEKKIIDILLDFVEK